MNTRQALNQLALVNSYILSNKVKKPVVEDVEKPKAKRGRKSNGHKSKQESMRTLSVDDETTESSKET